MADSTLNRFVASGTAAEMAAFTPTPPTPASGPDAGYFWYQTDTGDTYSWDGAAWQIVGGGGSGTVTNTGTLTANALILGNGGVDVTALGSLGTTTTVLHGNAAGAPTFGAVALGTDVSGDLPFANLVQATGASKLVGRGSAGGAGDFEEIAISSGLEMSTTNLRTLAGVRTRTVTFSWGDASTVLTTGTKAYINGTPFAGTITGAYLVAHESGSIVIDIWKTTSGSVPTNSDSITSATPPTLSSAQIGSDTTLSSWTTSVALGDVWGFNIDSVTTITQITLVLNVAVTG